MTQPLEIKFFEVRDRGTNMPAMAIKMIPRDSVSENYIMQKAGFSPDAPFCVELVFIEISRCGFDPYDWNDRTRMVAHQYIEKNFEVLESGSVVDVEFILGETKTKKQSEMITDPLPTKEEWEELTKDCEVIYV